MASGALIVGTGQARAPACREVQQAWVRAICSERDPPN